MVRFSVNQLAKLAGVSVRTLHHYDHIGLLKPQLRTESKYRYYGEKELLRLQQILFYRELEIPLARVAELLDDPSFKIEEALRAHKVALIKRKKRTLELLKTIDKTLIHLKQKNMNYEDMYKGFDNKQAKAYEKEAKEKWGDQLVEESKQRVQKMGEAGLKELLAEQEKVNQNLSELMHLNPDDSRVQKLTEKHHHLINQFYTVTPEIYRGLADLYVNDNRFTQHYDKHKPGLAAFLRAAMLVYCDGL